MSLFEPDGVYANIPYRVLPDCSIEAMMPGGLIKFKNIEQLIASTAGTPTVTNGTHSVNPYDILDVNERARNLPVSAQPLDYHSILLGAIKKTEQDSAQLRALVYERARFNFKRDILYGHSSLALTDLVRHIQEFELAVARIEANSIDDQTNRPHQEQTNPPHQEQTSPPHREDEHELIDQGQAEVFDTAYSSSNAVQILPPAPLAPMYIGPNQQIENFEYHRRLDEIVPRVRFANQLIVILILGIMFIGTVIVAGALWHSPAVSPPIEIASKVPKTVETPKVSFPLPTSYGIYVLSDNKLTELKSLPINVPDARVALSAELKTPSTTTISDDKPAFILFRRDLLNNAPQKITLRVIAHMARETKFVAGSASMANIEGAWRIRNISREYKVSPIPGQSEMIIARPEKNEPLAAGRYALVLNRVGYDVTVKGPVQSPEFCLEGFETANGSVLTQCRTP